MHPPVGSGEFMTLTGDFIIQFLNKTLNASDFYRLVPLENNDIVHDSLYMNKLVFGF